MLPSPSRVAATSLHVIPRKGLSRALGRAARVSAPRALLRAAILAYCKAYQVDLDEYLVPEGGFETFDDFFTRKLKPGSRPVDSDREAVLSPADGRLEDAGTIEVSSMLRIKGRNYSVSELLEDRLASTLYAGGQFAVVYLSPRDYHRVHAPVSGAVRLLRHVPGTLFPVNAIGLRHIPRLFARNERVVVEQGTADHGPVSTVLVGAIGVGRISVSFDPQVITNDGRSCGEIVFSPGAGPELKRGDELGAFHLGSTVIVFVGPSAGLSLVKRPGDHVRFGEALWRRHRSDPSPRMPS
jgi:phosphatidylserine decarboxylase